MIVRDDQDDSKIAPEETGPVNAESGPEEAADQGIESPAGNENGSPEVEAATDDAPTEMVAADEGGQPDQPPVQPEAQSDEVGATGSEAAGQGEDGAQSEPAFDAPVVKPADDNGDLVLDLDGYEGPIDVLLTLARDQKVDLKKISILELADQYLIFVAKARRLRLELAADYLVMAAWLAYLKSRLLLPEPPKDGEPSGAEMAAALAFQLQRLAAMQKAGQALLALPQLNRDFFRRGEPEPVRLIQVPVFNLTLYELLKAYGTHPGRKREGILHIEPMRLFSMDDALHRIGDLIGHRLDWTVLRDFLPDEMQFSPLQRRAALAATFAASLELARSGKVQLRQDGTFGPIYLKAGSSQGWSDSDDVDGGGNGGTSGGSSGNSSTDPAEDNIEDDRGGEQDTGVGQGDASEFNQGSQA